MKYIKKYSKINDSYSIDSKSYSEDVDDIIDIINSELDDIENIEYDKANYIISFNRKNNYHKDESSMGIKYVNENTEIYQIIDLEIKIDFDKINLINNILEIRESEMNMLKRIKLNEYELKYIGSGGNFMKYSFISKREIDKKQMFKHYLSKCKTIDELFKSAKEIFYHSIYISVDGSLVINTGNKYLNDVYTNLISSLDSGIFSIKKEKIYKKINVDTGISITANK